jgi:exonuclease III
MRIVTWNVWGRYGPWEDRAPRILETLAELRPDVLCLQEVSREGALTHADVIGQHLGMQAATRRPGCPVRSREAAPTSSAWPCSAAGR